MELEPLTLEDAAAEEVTGIGASRFAEITNHRNATSRRQPFVLRHISKAVLCIETICVLTSFTFYVGGWGDRDQEVIVKTLGGVAQSNYSRTVAIMIHGESFRAGGQHNRLTGTPQSVQSQHVAVKSQVENMLRPIRDQGYSVLVFLSTSSSSFNHELYQWYEEYIPSGGKATFGGARRERDVAKLYAEYEMAIGPAAYFIFIRPDVILKQNVVQFWMLHQHHVAFTFKEWCYWSRLSGCQGLADEVCYRVPDMVVSMPHVAFDHVRTHSNIHFGHNMYMEFVNAGYPPQEISFWIDAGHDSDTAKDWNPLYKLAGRPESSTDVCNGTDTSATRPK